MISTVLEFHKLEYPFSHHHINIKQVFADNLGLRKGVGLGSAMKRVNLSFVGSPHRGIDDARNMASLAGYIFQQS